jgi:two-component system response regulator AtoC
LDRTTDPESFSDGAATQRPTVVLVAPPNEAAARVEETLGRRGHAVVRAGRGAEAVEIARRERQLRVAVVVLPLPDVTARAFVPQLREAGGGLPIVLMGRDDDVRDAADAFELGAEEYVEDTLPDPSDFLATIGVLLGSRRGDRHLQYLRSKEALAGWSSVVGHSPAIERVVGILKRVCIRTQAGSTPTIFLDGETGTGKGTAAKCVHYNGVRRNRPYVEVNCATLPSSLVETELFGHERGSFTDAKAARSGLFETADGGTLFLDEIGAVPLDLQAKLLTAIEEKQVRRVGGRHLIAVDVQIIAATHENLRRRVKDGSFREDLFHRLNVVAVTMPPLREREDDVIELAEAFLRKLCKEYGTPPRTLSEATKDWMRRYSWPGNVRELRNQIERMVLLESDPVVSVEHFSVSSEAGPNVQVTLDSAGIRVSLPPNGVALAALERAVIREALARCDGNVSQAARFLSISRQTLIYRMKKHGLVSEESAG